MAILPHNLNLPPSGGSDSDDDPFDINDLLNQLAEFDGGDDPLPVQPPSVNIVFPQVDREREQPISPFIKSGFPEYIAVDHSTFTDFIKAYYEWLEKSGNPTYISRRFGEYIDIDETLDGFIPYFLATYAPFLPDELQSGADLRNVIPSMIDFYQKKGTKDSLKFFFRMLYNVDIELFYPKLTLMKTSDGRYVERSVIKGNISGMTAGRWINLNGRPINQYHDNKLIASAAVESVQWVLEKTGPMYNIQISDVFGAFKEGNPAIISDSDNNDISVDIVPTIGFLNVSTGGTNYKIGESISITGTGPAADFIGFKGEISAVNSSGTITGVKIIDGGVRASGKMGSTYAISINSREGDGATLGVSGGYGSMNLTPYYEGEVGRLSSGSFIQDNFFYQEFSYVIRTQRGILEYIDLLRKLVHPAGLKPFGRYLLTYNDSTSLSYESGGPTRYEMPLIGHYSPYTFGTTQNLRYNVDGVDLYPIGFNGQTGTIADFTGVVAEAGSDPHVVGITGALGSTLGGALGHTIGGGLGAVGIYNDGGTGYLNRADFYEQYEIFAGGISGPTFSGYTMGWSVYPHPAHRGATHILGGMSMGCTFTRLGIDPNPPIYSSGQVSEGDIIVQYPWDYAPAAVGIVVSITNSAFWALYPNLIVDQITTEQPFVTTTAPGVQQGTVAIYNSSGATVYQSEGGLDRDRMHGYDINLDPKMAYIQIGDFIREMPA